MRIFQIGDVTKTNTGKMKFNLFCMILGLCSVTSCRVNGQAESLHSERIAPLTIVQLHECSQIADADIKAVLCNIDENTITAKFSRTYSNTIIVYKLRNFRDVETSFAYIAFDSIGAEYYCETVSGNKLSYKGISVKSDSS
jgi:hypothetical protein